MSKQKPTRDIQAEKILVREKWQLVHANIKVDDAMKAFLTEGLDVCGQSVAFAAFDLVRQVLNPMGYVRRDHTGELRNLGAVVRAGDSAWSEKGRSIHTKWDFNDAWSSYRTKSPLWQKEYEYTELPLSTVAQFCEMTNLQSVPRNECAEYVQGNVDDIDGKYALPVLDHKARYCSTEVFDKLPNLPVKRWEIKQSSFSKILMQDLYDKGLDHDYVFLQESTENCLEPYWRLAMRVNKWRNTKASGDDDDDDTRQGSDALETAAAIDLTGLPGAGAPPKFKNSCIQTAARKKVKLTHERLIQFRDSADTNLNDVYVADLKAFVQARGKKGVNSMKSQVCQGHIRTFLHNKSDDEIRAMSLTKASKPSKAAVQAHTDSESEPEAADDIDNFEMDEEEPSEHEDEPEEPDDDEPGETGAGAAGAAQLQREYGYFVKHRTCNHKDKPDLVLKVGYFSEQTGLFKQRSVIAEIDGHDKTKRPSSATNVDSIKLALKLMSSTSVQAVLQPETYHIRSNLSQYLHGEIVQSVMAATKVHLPDFQEFLEGLHNGSKDYSELVMFQNAIHWVHHLFLAHVKIAFLIYMREMHDIDMLSADTRDPRMRDHFFFINFPGSHLPTELMFEHRCPRWSRKWLEDRLMLLTRVKIKSHDNNLTSWKFAPVVNASSRHANMQTWKADVRSMQVPDFPYEETSMMPIACATTQRVDMRKLCKIVTEAAAEAARAYMDARNMPENVTHRQFPDRCFLLRRQQLERHQWWSALRVPAFDEENDELEYNWGFEDPVRQRSYTDATECRHWDQIDVRMHLFDAAMANTAWKAAADGMWYVQDFTDFMCMLQNLDLPVDVSTNACSREYGFRLPDAQQNNMLPQHSHVNDRACHRFSVLSWFFDCRDAGACRYAWEDYVLDYFGAYTTAEKSEFDEFELLQTMPRTQYKYFKNPWFQIVLFMEHNFRNAIAQMHYRLFDMKNTAQVEELQKKAKTLYNRQRQMLNNRTCFDGLQVANAVGSSLLSFTRFHATSNANMTLRERIMSQMDDELPMLDPFLRKYVAQFKIPDAELFLRMIRCPNVLALRELAVQHRHLLGGPSTAQAVQKTSPLLGCLHFFPIGVQSEILYMLQFVERDESVYTNTVAIHESKLMIVPQDLLRRWIRETLEVAERVHSLHTPLQMKCYMFTMPELSGGGVGAFNTLKRLFYTTEAMMNYGSKRSIVFVLLQMRLALLQMQNAQTSRSNPLVDFFESRDVNENCTYSTVLWPGKAAVQWTPGTCREEWPRRDVNEFVLPFKTVYVDTTVIVSGAQNVIDVENIQSDDVLGELMRQAESSTAKCVFTRHGMDKAYGETYGMTEHERNMWLLLLYARPNRQQFRAEDNTQVIQSAESKKDCIVAKLLIKSDSGNLACEVVDNMNAPLFFEKLERNYLAGKSFPKYVQAVITAMPDRKLIYVPKVFAHQLRQEESNLHTVIFTHNQCSWQMLCVGTRAWAWKRLMVKSIFMDAFAKIMTRSSVQLALYGPVQNFARDDSYRDNWIAQHESITSRHELTSTVLGKLDFKLALLKRNLAPKAAQLIFTTHEKTHRVASIGDARTLFVEKKIADITRQLQFVVYCHANWARMRELKSCRYMLVDKRILSKHLPQQDNEAIHDVLPQDALLHRSYLYLLEENSAMLVQFRRQVYIKFPQDYAVIRVGNDFQTGKMEHGSAPHIYATFFDTRTYSCVKSKLERKADSAEMMHVITACTDIESTMPASFPTTEALAGNCQSWILQHRKKVTMCKSMSPVIFYELLCNNVALQLQEQQDMYTLPDVFCREHGKRDAVKRLSTVDDTLRSWSENIDRWAEDSIANWIALRRTTKYIASAEKVLEDKDNNIQHALLQPMIRQIRSGLLQSTSIDKSPDVQSDL